MNNSDRSQTSDILAWAVAAEVHYAESADWQLWADEIIKNTTDPDIWIINLSLADSIEDVRGILRDSESRLSDQNSELYGEIGIGLIYKIYERGDYSVKDVLSKLGRWSDGSRSNKDPSLFSSLLNDFERKSLTEEAVRDILRDEIKDSISLSNFVIDRIRL